MAKMFYTLDETKVALGQSEEAVKQFIRDGRLREFRDGPKIMFKADQVDALKGQIGGGGALELADSGAPIGLADTGGGSGIGLSLADSIGSGIAGGSGLTGISGSGLGSGMGSGLGSSGAGSGMMNLKEDSGLAADLGLSGTMGGLTAGNRSKSGTAAGGSLSGGSLAGGSLAGGSLAGGSLGGGSLGGGTLGGGSLGGGSLGGGSLGGGSLAGGSLAGTAATGSRPGINVFGDDTHVGADPMAQTATPGPGGSDLNLEAVGSGSGLLDLTRESDETSLGAELLDEIPRGGGGSRPLAPPDTGSMAGIPMPAGGGIVRGGMSSGPIVVEARDTTAGAFGGLALGTAFVVLFAIFALMTGVMGVNPESVRKVADNGFWIVVAFGAGVAILFFVFGLLISKSVRR